ncbi:response regulator [Brevibacillus ruminantium]|uniref:Response regulator n=1 Tax=Brevibacillus ruminantium TaxID=2950604 RepID=A0ABY4WB34_9BACL|nr:response regulator [Brevibacillus ruminantium]USG64378.1 response regulator [Brevibacillus ruminantium]
MAVFMRDRFGELPQQLFHMTNMTVIRHQPCGVILAPCTNINQQMLDQLESFVSKSETKLAAKYLFDDQNLIFAMVVEDGKFAATHYTSLIVKDFLESHGLLQGQLVVASFPECGKPTEGTVSELINLAIMARGEDKEIRLFVEQSPDQGISSILVVDPDEVVREFVTVHLELEGYKVFEAKDGAEALEKYSQVTPDLVITELNLPIVDGYQLINKIKQQSETEGKVLVLTDKQLIDHLNRSYEVGAIDYVTKPFSISELHWRIKKLGEWR